MCEGLKCWVTLLVAPHSRACQQGLGQQRVGEENWNQSHTLVVEGKSFLGPGVRLLPYPALLSQGGPSRS